MSRYLNLALVETLQAHGYTVISAHNGREALDLLEEHLPDVIICDINMPVMDGYTFLQHRHVAEAEVASAALYFPRRTHRHRGSTG